MAVNDAFMVANEILKLRYSLLGHAAFHSVTVSVSNLLSGSLLFM